MTPLPASASRLPVVLLVEDDPTNQLIALSMLRHMGIEADSASDGRVGVQRATEKAYDVILMDIQMPVMDGVEAMKAIRALLPPEQCPRILAVTAHAVAGTREHLLAAGFDDFYNKPLSISLLRTALTPEPEPVMIVRAPSPDHDAHAAMASEAVIQAVRAHVREMLGEEDEDFVHELVESFAESSQQAIREIRTASAAGDREAIARAAHQLKGSASNIGLATLTESWDRIETDLRTGTADLGGTLDQVVEDTTRTVGMLETVLR